MTTTTSSVTDRKCDEANAALLRRWCEQCALAGGSFGIATKWDGPMGLYLSVYTINWPDGKEPK